MRVAALYDVHGNAPALDAVLAEVGDVDVVLFGGDIQRRDQVQRHLDMGWRRVDAASCHRAPRPSR